MGSCQCPITKAVPKPLRRIQFRLFRPYVVERRDCESVDRRGRKQRVPPAQDRNDAHPSSSVPWDRRGKHTHITSPVIAHVAQKQVIRQRRAHHLLITPGGSIQLESGESSVLRNRGFSVRNQQAILL